MSIGWLPSLLYPSIASYRNWRSDWCSLSVFFLPQNQSAVEASSLVLDYVCYDEYKSSSCENVFRAGTLKPHLGHLQRQNEARREEADQPSTCPVFLLRPGSARLYEFAWRLLPCRIEQCWTKCNSDRVLPGRIWSDYPLNIWGSNNQNIKVPAAIVSSWTWLSLPDR